MHTTRVGPCLEGDEPVHWVVTNEEVRTAIQGCGMPVREPDLRLCRSQCMCITSTVLCPVAEQGPCGSPLRPLRILLNLHGNHNFRMNPCPTVGTLYVHAITAVV